MKGVVVAGGLGTRLYPLTHVTNKHLLPVYDRPMIFYPIQTLVGAGIDEVIVVTGGPHAEQVRRILGDGKNLGLRRLEYTFQPGEAGIADALSFAESFSEGDSVCVILGDNCTDADIRQEIREFTEGATIFLKEVVDPHRFGVPVFDKDQRVILIEEKPMVPHSSFAVTGLYLYDATVFDKIKKIKPSGRGELEITDVNNLYLNENKLNWRHLRGYWRDAGTFGTLFEAARYWFQKSADAPKTL